MFEHRALALIVLLGVTGSGLEAGDSAIIQILEAKPSVVSHGDRLELTFRVTNTGSTTWSPLSTWDCHTFSYLPSACFPYPQESGYYGLQFYLFKTDSPSPLLNFRAAQIRLPRVLAPGATAQFPSYFEAPNEPGQYTLTPVMARNWAHAFSSFPLGNPSQVLELSTNFKFTVSPKSFFDGFNTSSYSSPGVLKYWMIAGSGGCTPKPRGPQSNKFCADAEHVDATPSKSEVRLTATISGGERTGAELQFEKLDEPDKITGLPSTGTFAARVNLDHHGERQPGKANASIKAFYTYFSAPEKVDTKDEYSRVHFEQDFEILTGNSDLYSSQQWLSSPAWGANSADGILKSNRSPPWKLDSHIITNNTHNSSGTLPEPEEWHGKARYQYLRKCGEADKPFTEELSQHSMKNGLVALNLYSSQDFYFVIQSVCEPPCTGLTRTYRTRYFVTDGGSQCWRLGATQMKHATAATDLVRPMFNVWWLEPTQPHYSNPQSMIVKWFLWSSQSDLAPTDAVKIGDHCDSAVDKDKNHVNGINVVGTNGCN